MTFVPPIEAKQGDLPKARATDVAECESKRFFRDLMQNARVVAVMLDPEGRILFANPFLLRLTDWSLEEVLGKDWFRLFIPSEQTVKVKEIYRSVIAGTLVSRYEDDIITRCGERRQVEWNHAALRDDGGKTIGLACFGENTTNRHRAEEVIRTSKEGFKNIFENAPIGIYHSTVDRLVLVNPAGAAMFGYASPEEMLESASSAGEFFVNPEQRRQIVHEVLASEAYSRHEVEYLRKDGTSFTALVHMRSVRDEASGTRCLRGFFEDISERKKLEHELVSREQLLNGFFTNSTAGLCILDADLRYVRINETLARLNGLSTSDHLGKTVAEVVAKLAPILEPILRQVQATGEPVLNMEIRGERPNASGGVCQWMASYFPFLGNPGMPSAVGCVVVDITQQKQVEEKLRDSEEKFRQLAEHINKVFWMSDKDLTEMLYVSPAYERIWGRSCQSLYERPASFVEAIHPEDRDLVKAGLERKQLGEVYEEEYRIVRPDGSVRWIHDRGFAVRNEKGEFYRTAGLAEDITERRQLEEQLRQAQKMEAVGQLAGGVAHDFNNILAAALMHLGLLQQSPQLTAAMKESLKELESETMRAANLTRQLLLFSRREVAKKEPLELNDLMTDLLKMMRRLLVENIEVVFQASADPAWVCADAGMMEQVVMNLCINARDAMPKGGQLKLTIMLTEIGTQFAAVNPEARLGRFVCLSVTDTGTGMDQAVLKRIFEPFFTSKEAGKGTGLGLATVYGIIKQHEGWVEVESAAGKGSSFRVYLPAAPMPSIAATAPGPKDIKGGVETVLLVEDELSLRRTVALGLRKLGYAVLEAGNGVEAITVWERHCHEIDLLLTDMVMPEAMTGLDLAARFVKEKSSLKVIIASGYSEDLAGSPFSAGQEIIYLSKPFSAAVLANTVRRCLDQA